MTGPSNGSSELVVATPEAMHDLGRRLATVLRAGDLVLLTGELGAGKTTLAVGVGAGLGVRGRVTSPTFVIAREHPHPDGGVPLVHVDAYRLGGLDDIDGLDLDASLDEAVTLVEWGTGLVEDLAASRLEIELERPRGDPAGDPGAADEQPRTVRVTAYGPRWDGVVLPV